MDTFNHLGISISFPPNSTGFYMTKNLSIIDYFLLLIDAWIWVISFSSFYKAIPNECTIELGWKHPLLSAMRAFSNKNKRLDLESC